MMPLRQREAEASRLAGEMPRLMLEARRSAATILHGLHGRRQAGSGDSFWQFRPFRSGEPAGRIDWRRSAKDQRLSVKEREWEAAHTLFLWADMGASMRYRSPLAQAAKDERALVLMMALADILVHGGERVGVLDVLRPSSSPAIIQLIGERMSLELPDRLPQTQPLPLRAEAVLLTDGLSPLEPLTEAMERLSAKGAGGHLVLVNDPAEEVFPFEGHVDFIGPDNDLRLRAGKAETLKAAYLERLGIRREAIASLCREKGWSLALHRTDQPAAPALLMLHQRLAASSSRIGAR